MTKEREIKRLERLANFELLSIPERLATIYRIYELRGVPRHVYSDVEPASQLQMLQGLMGQAGQGAVMNPLANIFGQIGGKA